MYGKWGYAKGELPPCQLDIREAVWTYMARSKNIHVIQHEVTITQPANTAGNAFDELIQVDVNLSEKLGRTIRNGNCFRLTGYGTALRSYDGSSDVDLGFGVTTAIQYAPVTKSSIQAWKGMFSQWKKQKNLANAQGGLVRYDDFEAGWDGSRTLPAGRNSTVRMTGLSDTNSEDVVLYGPSLNGAQVSLESYYDNLQPISVASTDPFGATIKSPKFTNRFPPSISLYSASTFSAGLETDTAPDSFEQGIAMTEMHWLPADNHISHLTGTLRVWGKVTPPDTAFQIPDDLKLIITLVYEGWNPIVGKTTYKPRMTTYKKKYNKSRSYGRKYRGRYKRRY